MPSESKFALVKTELRGIRAWKRNLVVEAYAVLPWDLCGTGVRAVGAQDLAPSKSSHARPARLVAERNEDSELAAAAEKADMEIAQPADVEFLLID